MTEHPPADLAAIIKARQEDAKRLRAWLAEVSFSGFSFHVLNHWTTLYMQASWTAPCSITGELLQHWSRQWLLHPEMTRSEVIQTALKLVLTAVEHEAREAFKVNGKAIYGPHISVDALAFSCNNVDARSNPE